MRSSPTLPVERAIGVRLDEALRRRSVMDGAVAAADHVRPSSAGAASPMAVLGLSMVVPIFMLWPRASSTSERLHRSGRAAVVKARRPARIRQAVAKPYAVAGNTAPF
jgi:hypothetical protein